MRTPLSPTLILPALLFALCLSLVDAHLEPVVNHARRSQALRSTRRQLTNRGLLDVVDPIVSVLDPVLATPTSSDSTTDTAATSTTSVDPLSSLASQIGDGFPSIGNQASSALALPTDSTSVSTTDSASSSASTSTTEQSQSSDSSSVPSTSAEPASSTEPASVTPTDSSSATLAPTESPSSTTPQDPLSSFASQITGGASSIGSQLSSVVNPPSTAPPESTTPSSEQPSSAQPTSEPSVTSEPSATSQTGSPITSDPPASTTPYTLSSIISQVTGDVSSAVSQLTSVVAPEPTSSEPSSAPPQATSDPATSSQPPVTSPPPSSGNSISTIISQVSSGFSSAISQVTSVVVPPSSASAPSSIPTPPPSASASNPISVSVSQSNPVSESGSFSASQSGSFSASQSGSFSASQSDSFSQSVTVSQSGSISFSASVTESGSFSASQSGSLSASASASASASFSDSGSVSRSSTPVISFPTASSTSESVTTSKASSTTIPPFSLPSDLTFLTESSLMLQSTPTTEAPSLTNPDQTTTSMPTTFSQTSLSAAPLPSGLPARIFPPARITENTDLTDMTMVSILFTSRLNWKFVALDQVAQGQVIGFMPQVLSTALEITTDQIKTFALQVYKPSSYLSSNDVDKLGTTFLAFIPSDKVDTLAAQIIAKKSAFYTGTPADSVARQLAAQVDSGFAITSVTAPPELGSNANGAAQANSNASSSNSRQDAIIGVVTSLGGVALLVLVFLVFRSWKRRRELAHRRMSDPPNDIAYGVRPEGREFDQDSTGAPRRRSFYFAEDSLRGFQEARDDNMAYDSRSQTQNMTQRRPILASNISAPVLRSNTLNF